MKHYLSGDNFKYEVEMGCNHPTPETRKCSGNCEQCRYGIATLKISDFLHIAELTGCNRIQK